MQSSRFAPKCLLPLLSLVLGGALSDLHALPAGFADHGVAAPVGRQPFGTNTFATADDEGRRIVFSKMWTGDETSYLFIDAETGVTRQIGPGIGGRGGWPIFLSLENKAYDTLGDGFMEIDVSTGEVQRVGEIPGGMAMGYAMDEKSGTIYAGIYPSATLVSYHPSTGVYRNHGPLGTESWPQYLRPLAVDAEGWVYGGIGQSLAQVVGHHPTSGETRAFVPREDRKRGQGEVFLGTDGKVYGNAVGWGWHVLSGGKATPIAKPPVSAVSRSNTRFPDGSRFIQVDIPNRSMRIMDTGAVEPREVTFDYESNGVRIYCVVAGPDGNVYGATGIPLRVWRFDPENGAMDDWGLAGHAGHVNQFALQGEKLYGAVYSSGSLIEYDPAKPFHDASIGVSRNPRQLHGGVYGHGGSPDLFGRPYVAFAHPDGRNVLMGGNPSRVSAGGGILIYDLETGEETVLKPDQLVRNQGVISMGALPNGDLIVGSTTVAATAGTSAASVAQLYRIDWKTKEVVQRWTPSPAVRSISDLLVDDDGLVYVKASASRFLVLDPDKGEFLHDETIETYGPLTGGQAPRTMTFGPDGGIYLLFRDAIARMEIGTFTHREIARPGIAINAGIAIVNDRLYFTSGGRLLSYDLALEPTL